MLDISLTSAPTSETSKNIATNRNEGTGVVVVDAWVDVVQAGSESRMLSGLDDIQPAEDLGTSTTNAGLQSSSLVNPDYEAHNFIDFGAVNEYLLPSAPSSASISVASTSTATVLPSVSLTHVHKDLGFGFPQNMQPMHTSQRFSSSRSRFNMLMKPKYNPWNMKWRDIHFSGPDLYNDHGTLLLLSINPLLIHNFN
jgi:hypothetical protein